MFDPISQGLAAVSTRAASAAPLVFLAGVTSSVGPCIAPRLIAIAGITAGTSRKRAATLVLAFIGGLAGAYAAFGAVSSLLASAMQLSAYTYAAVAIALAAGGVLTLWRGETKCVHRHVHPASGGAGAALLLGASCALVISPCCTPLVLGILAYGSVSGSPLYGSALLACFALGHALPVLAVAFGANGAANMLARYSVREAANVISATLMLGLAGYYAVLA